MLTAMLRIAVVMFYGGAALAAFEPTLDSRAIAEAVGIGISRLDVDRDRLHRLYRIEVSSTPIDWIDIVTPFRRVALEAEAQTRAGARLFGQREAIESLGAAPLRVDIVVELTFHPLNTFVGVPLYGVSLVSAATPRTAGPSERRSPGEQSVEPSNIEHVPRFGPRVGNSLRPYPFRGGGTLPQVNEPLLGGIIVAQFDGDVLDQNGTYDIVVRDGNRELARARIDLERLR